MSDVAQAGKARCAICQHEQWFTADPPRKCDSCGAAGGMKVLSMPSRARQRPARLPVIPSVPSRLRSLERALEDAREARAAAAAKPARKTRRKLA